MTSKSSTTSRRARTLEPIHPREILLEEFMKPLAIGVNRLASDLDVPPNRISGIVNRRRAITADTALRLGIHFGVSPEIWLGLQADYEMRSLWRRRGTEIARRVRRREAA